MSHELEVRPEPAFSLARKDYFGNEYTYFCIHEPHQTLTVTALSQVTISSRSATHEGLTPSGRKCGMRCAKPARIEAFRALESTFRSPKVNVGAEFVSASRICNPSYPYSPAFSFSLCRAFSITLSQSS